MTIPVSGGAVVLLGDAIRALEDAGVVFRDAGVTGAYFDLEIRVRFNADGDVDYEDLYATSEDFDNFAVRHGKPGAEED